MSVVLVATEVATTPGDLDEISRSIHANYQLAQQGAVVFLDAYLSIGRDLAEARDVLVTDREYGAWFRSQEFPFTQQWAWTLREAAANETAVRDVVTSQLVTGRGPNIQKALAAVREGSVGPSTPAGPSALPAGSYSTIVADPPWQYGNTSTRGAAEDHYSTMTIEELCALDIAERAAEESHLYLWTTNGFMREAFAVLDAWGFTYKTLLTWVKPQMGMGNYFRGATEHVLFGTKGGLGTNDKATMNWFESPRGKHSAKPDCFYDLVEKSSPGPYLEMFARRRRLGWESWGNEA